MYNPQSRLSCLSLFGPLRSQENVVKRSGLSGNVRLHRSEHRDQQWLRGGSGVELGSHLAEGYWAQFLFMLRYADMLGQSVLLGRLCPGHGGDDMELCPDRAPALNEC